MSLLFERLPDTVEICGCEVAICTDFRLWARVEHLCSRHELTGQALLDFLHKAFDTEAFRYPIELLADAFNQFLLRGKERAPADKHTYSQDTCRVPYDFVEDEGRIISAFQREYNIDLTSESVHWWRFCTLLEDLMAKNKFTDIVYFRVMDINAIKDEREREYYSRCQSLYRIGKENDPQTVEEYNKNLVDIIKRAKQEAGL